MGKNGGRYCALMSKMIAPCGGVELPRRRAPERQDLEMVPKLDWIGLGATNGVTDESIHLFSGILLWLQAKVFAIRHRIVSLQKRLQHTV